MEGAADGAGARHGQVHRCLELLAGELAALEGAVPAINQCEMSIQGYDNATIKYCQAHGIVYESYGAMRGCPFTVRAALGWLSALRVFLWKYILYGAFVWVRRALNSRKLRFPARAAEDPLGAPRRHRTGRAAPLP